MLSSSPPTKANFIMKLLTLTRWPHLPRGPVHPKLDLHHTHAQYQTRTLSLSCSFHHLY
ncbi:hypothetical protein BDR03DRAFT_950648 [Suillus americanus]|nr:hypothetical protein BDR03DRAFT_950648 [Suillus americanus]